MCNIVTISASFMFPSPFSNMLILSRLGMPQLTVYMPQVPQVLYKEKCWNGGRGLRVSGWVEQSRVRMLLRRASGVITKSQANPSLALQLPLNSGLWILTHIKLAFLGLVMGEPSSCSDSFFAAVSCLTLICVSRGSELPYFHFCSAGCWRYWVRLLGVSNQSSTQK